MGSFFNEGDGAGIPSVLADRLFRTVEANPQRRGRPKAAKKTNVRMMLFIGQPT